MKTRILSAAALLPLLLVIVLVLPAWATAALFGAAAAIAAYELLYRTGLVKNLRLVCYAMVMAVLVAFWSLRQDANLASIGILVYLAVLLGETLLAHGHLRFEKVCLCLVAGLLLPYLLTHWSAFGPCMPARTLGKMIWGNITFWSPLSWRLPPIPARTL